MQEIGLIHSSQRDYDLDTVLKNGKNKLISLNSFMTEAVII